MIDVSKQRVVLIGGAGFIGHNLALQLKKMGAEVVVLDSLAVNNLVSVLAHERDANQQLDIALLHERLDLLRSAGVRLYVEDARDYLKLSTRLREAEPTVVVHLAAIAHNNRSNKDPFSTFDHNLRTLENALDVVRANMQHFIFFSSSMVYGNFPTEVVTEDTPCDPIGIYGALKYSGEKIVIAYNQVFGLPYTIVRPSALYGERCISRRVAQIFVEKALRGEPIKIDGDGSDRLDFTYIQDVVQGIIKCIQSENARNQIFNLTYGSSRSLADLATIIQQHFPGIDVSYMPKDKLTPSRGTLSIDKARNLIDYSPQFPLEKGLPLYLEWYKEAMGRYKRAR
jgi:nucleoside-diphosphate-sugar epimerase